MPARPLRIWGGSWEQVPREMRFWDTCKS